MTSTNGTDPKIAAIGAFFAAYDLDGMREVLTDDIEWTIPGHHPISGTKHGVEEVVAYEYVVDIHHGWSTEGEVDTMWALVWHFNTEGKVDRVHNLSGDQHQMDAFIWANYTLAPIPARLA